MTIKMSSVQNRPEQGADTEDRTTAIGLFNTAESWRRSADYLSHAKLRITHPQMPTGFLYYHCIELYLKAFLRLRGASVEELMKFRHGILKLHDLAAAQSFLFMEEDLAVITLFHEARVYLRWRYIETGSICWPTNQAMARTAKSLHDTAKIAFQEAGHKMRRR
jgi:hypothetical protein